MKLTIDNLYEVKKYLTDNNMTKCMLTNNGDKMFITYDEVIEKIEKLKNGNLYRI